MVEQQEWTDNTVPVAEKVTQSPESTAAQARQALSADVLPNITIGATVGDNAGTLGAGKDTTLAEKLEKLERVAKFEAKEKEPPFTNQERFMLNALRSSIKQNDLGAMTDALSALSDNLPSAHRVLSQLRSEMQTKSTLVNFQTGKDQDGKPFVALQVDNVFNGGFRASNNGAEIIPSRVKEQSQYKKYR
jgi:hypothetical protein